jgi:hypothetical protein
MLNYDDMAVGEIEDIHDQTVSKLMDRARTVNVKFNKDKLQYKQPEVNYVGQVFSAQGMKVDPDRIESLKKELQRVIGMFNFVISYFPNMSELVSSLCQLLRNYAV